VDVERVHDVGAMDAHREDAQPELSGHRARRLLLRSSARALREQDRRTPVQLAGVGASERQRGRLMLACMQRGTHDGAAHVEPIDAPGLRRADGDCPAVEAAILQNLREAFGNAPRLTLSRRVEDVPG
jgi:hypothetical protein